MKSKEWFWIGFGVSVILSILFLLFKIPVSTFLILVITIWAIGLIVIVSSEGKIKSPFEMWGPWIGALTSLIYFLFSTKNKWFDIRDILIRIGYTLDVQTGGLIISTILTLFLGFLIGWGIESLIRRKKW